MVTPQQIATYLRRVPPLPESLKKSLDALSIQDLGAAAEAAATDPVVIAYLKEVVNSAAFGFKSRMNDAKQIFSALGIERAKELLYAYMVRQLAPKRWSYFSMDPDDFHRFQLEFMHRWEKLVRHEKAEEKYLAAAAIMSAGLVVADAIFGDHASEVTLIRESGDIDLDTILERVSHMRFERLVTTIAKKWEVDEDVIRLVKLAFGRETCDREEKLCRLAKLLHLLLFYELSRPVMLEAGANAFVSFHPEFASDLLDTFQDVVEAA